MIEPSTTTIYQLAERWRLTPPQIIEAAIDGQIDLYFRLGNCAIAALPNPTPGNKLRMCAYQGYLRADKAALESILNGGEAHHVQEAYLPGGQRVYVELPPHEVAPPVGGVATRIQMATPLTIKTEGLCAFMDEVKAHEKVPPVSTMGVNGDTCPVVPPESWNAQSPYGLQRCDGTVDGRLVRLADVVAWLMQALELPCLNAVELVCTALAQPPSAANALYLLSENDYANVLKATHSFFYLPIMSICEDYPEGTAEDKGLDGALKYMRSYWGESSAPGAGNWCGQHVLDPLAVRLSLAHRLWGYGRRGDDVAQESAPEANKSKGVSLTVRIQRKWWDIASPFMAKTLKDQHYTTAKALYSALGATAGQNDSPFDRGDGINRGSLIVREITKPLSLKSVQNHWQKLKDLAAAS